MSTTIGTITGKFEVPQPKKMESDYKDAKMFLTAFWGGTVRGRCLQITISADECAYIQLEKEKIDQLINLLNFWKTH